MKKGGEVKNEKVTRCSNQLSHVLSEKRTTGFEPATTRLNGEVSLSKASHNENSRDKRRQGLSILNEGTLSKASGETKGGVKVRR